MASLLTPSQLDEALVYNRRRGYTKAQIRQVQQLVGAPVDGGLGRTTVERVADWQQANALDVDGKLGPVTWAAMRATWEAEPALGPLHPLPSRTRRWGYDHLPLVWHQPDPQWLAITSDGSFASGLLRLVTGYAPSGGSFLFSRGPDSWISLDELSIGIAHWWSDTAPRIFSAIASDSPTLAAWAWGEQVAPRMANLDWLRQRIDVKRGKRLHKAKYDWLLSGWYELARHPRVVFCCAEAWLQGYTPPMLRLMHERGWRRARTAAGLVRMTNSRGEGGMRRLVNLATRFAATDDEERVLETAFFHHDLYDHPERLAEIDNMPEFAGDLPTPVALTVPVCDSEAVRVDGTRPGFIAAGFT